MRVQRALAASAVAVMAGLALTACQGDVSGSATVSAGGQSPARTSTGSTGSGSTGSGSTGSGSTHTSGSSGSGSTGTGSGSGTGTGTGTGAAPAADQCTTANLAISAAVGKQTPPEADMREVSVTFTNKGTRCTLYGFAGVDLTTGEGPTSVPRGPHQPGTVTLAAGASTQFPIWFRTNPQGHTGIKVNTMTITPPGETHSVKLDWPGAEFANDADGGGTDTLYLEPVGDRG